MGLKQSYFFPVPVKHSLGIWLKAIESLESTNPTKNPVKLYTYFMVYAGLKKAKCISDKLPDYLFYNRVIHVQKTPMK